VFEAISGDPTSDDVGRQDFDSVNELLECVEDEVKADFSVGVIGVVDIAASRVDDIAAMWNVRVARKAAWTNAEVLWTLRHAPHIRSAFLRHTRQVHRTCWPWTPHPNSDRHPPHVVPTSGHQNLAG
jgi:hypothetical protein